MKHFIKIDAKIFVNIVEKQIGTLFLKSVGHTIEFIKFSEVIGYFDNDIKQFFISKEYLY